MRGRSREITEEDLRRRETTRILRVAKRAERWQRLPVEEPMIRLPLEPDHPVLPLWGEESGAAGQQQRDRDD